MSSLPAVRDLMHASALAGERVVAWARLAFCTAVGARAAYLWGATSLAQGHEAERAWIAFPAFGAGILFSIAVLTRLGGLGRRGRIEPLLHASVTLDAVLTFVALLPNVLWPSAEYRGLPFMIDLSALLVLAITAGLRHSTSAAILAGVLNLASFAVLTAADRAVSGDRIPAAAAHYTIWGLMLAAAVAIGLVIAVRTRSLVERAATAAVAAERAGRGLRTILRDHHDLRTVITSAQLNADLLARDLARAHDPADGAAVDHLRGDLGDLRCQLERVKARAFEELAELEAATPVAVTAVAAEVAAAMRLRFPATAITVGAAAGGGDGDRHGETVATVAGGAATLRRILGNLIANACEGDGRRAAAHVTIAARRNGGGAVDVVIADDGPGLPPHALTAPGEASSTKPTGAGLGMGIVVGLVKASGGSVRWSNPETGGARVVVELPSAC
jgi:signal transduction histidine kinase